VKDYACRLIEKRTLWSDWELLAFDAPDVAHAMRPGQLALMRDAACLDPYLRRRIWLYAIEEDRPAFVLPSDDPLATRARVGDWLDLLAPVGTAIEFEPTARHVLLVGEGNAIVRLIALAHSAIKQGREVVLVSQGTTSFPAHLLSPEIEYRSDYAVDGELITWADAIVASGPDELVPALANAIKSTRYTIKHGLARVIRDAPMLCGHGLCYACAVETTRGIHRACTDGPAFDLTMLDLRRLP
jgi:dihydroorotate dehydrogenase electron transfer subunit